MLNILRTYQKGTFRTTKPALGAGFIIWRAEGDNLRTI